MRPVDFLCLFPHQRNGNIAASEGSCKAQTRFQSDPLQKATRIGPSCCSWESRGAALGGPPGSQDHVLGRGRCRKGHEWGQPRPKSS